MRCPSDGATLVDDATDPLLGATIAGTYQLESVIGVGGFGRVYRARHVRLSRRFAVKVLRPSGNDAKLRRRFLREADAASRLRHDHVVGVVDVGESDGLPYLVMELAPGESLADMIDRDGPLARGRTVRVMRQVLGGLAHAHAHGLVHRDLKPANVMVEVVAPEREHARIVDFGVVLDAPAAGRLTTVGMVVGSPAYLSPEQAMGGPVDHRADLYSVGVSLYEAMSGTLPFSGAPVDLALQHVHATPSRIAGVPVDRNLEALAFWLMEKRPEDRPQHAHDVLDVLAAIEVDPEGARARLRRWMTPAATTDKRAIFQKLEDVTTQPIDAEPPTRHDTAPNLAATNRAWPPTVQMDMRARRDRKLAAGSAPPDAWGRIGMIVNEHFRIARVIGSGPHGTVYEAEDLETRHPVALKVLHRRAETAMPYAEREVRMAHQFDHANLIELDALGRLDDGLFYVVSAIVRGIDVAAMCNEGPMSERAALRVLEQALRGLEAAHRQAVPHGDLKPENLIVAGLGTADDGLAQVEPVRVVDLALSRLFRRGAASGLALEGGPYVAPEVASTGVPTLKGDVFAMGVMLAELLDVDPDGDGVASLSRETGFLLWRSTQLDPRDRYRDATEMRFHVETALRALD